MILSLLVGDNPFIDVFLVTLNSLYVHEAKMAFLLRVAQTRQGAERLLASRIFSVLAQCDFLDSRPDTTQPYIGMAFIELLNHP